MAWFGTIPAPPSPAAKIILTEESIGWPMPDITYGKYTGSTTNAVGNLES